MGGCTRIPWSAVDRWARRHALDAEAFDLLWHVIRAVDGVFVDHARAEAEKSQREQEAKRRRG